MVEIADQKYRICYDSSDINDSRTVSIPKTQPATTVESHERASSSGSLRGATAVGAFALKFAKISNIHPLIVVAGKAVPSWRP